MTGLRVDWLLITFSWWKKKKKKRFRRKVVDVTSRNLLRLFIRTAFFPPLAAFTIYCKVLILGHNRTAAETCRYCVASSDFFQECFTCLGDAKKPGKAFAAWTFSKSLLLVLSVNASAKVRVIVLGKCHRADRAALVSLLFVQFRPFSAVCLKQIQHAFAPSSSWISCMPANGWAWL